MRGQAAKRQWQLSGAGEDWSERDSGMRTKARPKNPHVVAAFFLPGGGVVAIFMKLCQPFGKMLPCTWPFLLDKHITLARPGSSWQTNLNLY